MLPLFNSTLVVRSGNPLGSGDEDARCQRSSSTALKRRVGLAADQSSGIMSVKTESLAKTSILLAELFRK